MMQVIQRYLLLAVGIALAGFFCVQAAPYLMSPRGDAGPTILQSQSPVTAMVASIICLMLGTAVAAAVARFSNSVVGLFVLGAGLFVLNGRLDTAQTFVFAKTGVTSNAPLLLLAVETLLWALLALAATMVVFAIGGRLHDVPPDEFNRTPHPLWSGAALKSAGAGALMLLAIWLIGQSPMKGQMIAATFFGGLGAGMAGRLIAPHVQPMLLFASPILFGAIGYVIAMFLVKPPLDAAYVAGKLPAFARAMPLTYVAGSFLGVAMGYGWARSLLHHEEQHVAAPAQT